MFKLIATPDFKWIIVWFGDDESREVARFYNRGEAQDYIDWRNGETDIPR